MRIEGVEVSLSYLQFESKTHTGRPYDASLKSFLVIPGVSTITLIVGVLKGVVQLSFVLKRN